MNIQVIKHPIEHIVVDNVYTNDELALIWRELEFITPKLKTPSVDNSASSGGVSLHSGRNLFLDGAYAMREISDILTLNRKSFSREIVEAAKLAHPFYSAIDQTNSDTTFINYYENSDEYRPHTDKAMFTALTFFKKDPADFSGGHLTFSEYSHLIELTNNRLVIFPSSVVHAATPVSLRAGGTGRYSMAQFLAIV